MQQAFPAAPAEQVRWRIPFCHHPPFCAGPQHRNTDGMGEIVELFERGGVRACFSGHEHNFQHSHRNAIDYFVSGAGSKIRSGAPGRTGEAHTVSWAAECHFLLVTVDATGMTVRAIGALANGELQEIERFHPDGTRARGPIAVAGQ